MIIALCASVSHYPELVKMADQLEETGFETKIPRGARAMKAAEHFIEDKPWKTDPSQYHLKTELIRDHFHEIEESDVVLITNYEKQNFEGYIGGNVLMEMTIAFYLHKPVYLLNKPSEKLPYYEEIMGMQPIILDGDLTKIIKETV